MVETVRTVCALGAVKDKIPPRKSERKRETKHGRAAKRGTQLPPARRIEARQRSRTHARCLGQSEKWMKLRDEAGCARMEYFKHSYFEWSCQLVTGLCSRHHFHGIRVRFQAKVSRWKIIIYSVLTKNGRCGKEIPLLPKELSRWLSCFVIDLKRNERTGKGSETLFIAIAG